MILGRHDIVEPDLLIAANPAQISPRGIEGAPPLVVDVAALWR